MSNTNQTLAQQKGLWGLSRPMLVEQALQFLVPVLDTFFLSRVADSAAAAAGAMTPVVFFCANILWCTLYSGASVANQRLGAGHTERANATIAIYGFWSFLLAVIISLSLHYAAPSIARLMGLSGNVLEHATTYLQIICWLILVLAGKGLLQTILNIYGKPQWNMHANIVYFIANIFGNAVVVFGLFGFPKMGVTGVAWASVIGSLCGVVVSAVAVLFILKYRFIFRVVITEFRSASRHIRRLAVPSMVEPLSFDLNMVVLNAMAASLGAVALAAKIYTFNIFMLGLIISVALTTATEVLMTQKLGAGKLQEVADQLRQSLKAGIWGTGLVAALLVIFNQPVMGLFTDNEILLSGAVWLFLLAALSEPPRTANIMVGRALRVSGDGWFISIVGPLFTWLVAVPLAWLLAMYFQLGVYGILIAAVVDETTRALLYLRRWKQNRWHHTNIHAEEQRSGAK